MNKDFEKYVYKQIAKYAKILLLDQHTIELKYPTETKDAILECVCQYPYLNATINYGDKVIQKWKNKENIIPYIVHELCHIITDPLYCKAVTKYVSKNEIEDEREKLTDYISHIVIKNKML